MIELRTDIPVEYVIHCGGDWMAVDAARVSTTHDAGFGPRELTEKDERLLYTLMKQRHKAPFQHSHLTIRVEAPLFVFREWRTHRIAMTQTAGDLEFLEAAFDPNNLSYSEASARYRPLKPHFWIPAEHRPFVDGGGSKMRPAYAVADANTYRATIENLNAAYALSWQAYQRMLNDAVAPEVARAVLGTGVYSSMYVTGNIVSWLHFLSLRIHDDNAAHVSYPQAEIEQAARQVEAILTERFPMTMRAFQDTGREM